MLHWMKEQVVTTIALYALIVVGCLIWAWMMLFVPKSEQ